jgi:hypothetical protein
MMWHAVSFWMENLTEVLIWSFFKTEVSFVMRIETHVPKNKIFKIQVLKTYLTSLSQQVDQLSNFIIQ